MSSAVKTSGTSPARGRSDLPLFLWSILAMVLSGVIIFVAVDAAMPAASVDSNSPNATTPGPGSSFDVR